MNRTILYLMVVALFSSCSYTKNWQGTSTSQLTQANFKELTGKQVFMLHVPTNDTYLAYSFSKNDGRLEATVKSSFEPVFSKAIEKSEIGSVHLVNQKGAEYKIALKGIHASGQFDVRFISTPQ